MLHSLDVGFDMHENMSLYNGELVSRVSGAEQEYSLSKAKVKHDRVCMVTKSMVTVNVIC